MSGGMTLEVRGSERLVRALRDGGRRLHRDLNQVVLKQAVGVQGRVKQKLSNDVLHIRTENLRRSIQVKRTGALEALVSTNVVYAAMHEFGGTIPAHMVKPKKAKALHWTGANGQSFFSRGHMIPATRIPKRSFMKPALDEQAPYLVEDIQDAIKRNLDNRGGQQAGH